jgi:hypothetical protein
MYTRRTLTRSRGAEESYFTYRLVRSERIGGKVRQVTLGLVLDGSGFVRRSRVFAGNAVEARPLEGMLEQLAAPQGAWVILDRGIATEENILWLKEKGFASPTKTLHPSPSA